MSDIPASLEPFIAQARTLLEGFCRQPSVAAQNLGIAEMADLTDAALRDAGFATRRLTAAGAPDIVYGEQAGRSPFTLLLYNHYDVQPAEPLELWASPPYEPTERDGQLYARGISDNKGELAARLAAIHALRDADGQLPISLKWIVEGEEEIGSPNFERLVAPHAALLRADGCLWEGPGFDHTDRPMVTLGSKGLLYVQYDVEATAADAHSALAAVLPSAAWRLVGALASLRTPAGKVAIPGFYDAVRPPSASDLAATADRPSVEPQLRASYAVEHFVNDVSGPALMEQLTFMPTGNIAGLGSGYTGEGVKTVLPARATAKMDFRLVPDQDPLTIAAALRAHLDAHGYTDVRLTVLGAAAPYRTPIDEPFAQRVARIAEEFSGVAPSLTAMSAGTLPLLATLHGFAPMPGLGAPDNVGYHDSGAHAPNEHIRLSDLRRAVAFNVYLFRALATP